MDYKKDTNQNLGQQTCSPDSPQAQERKTFYLSLSQRTEKAATAIYMVTNHIDDREAIKSAFRDAALALVLETISLEDFLHPIEEIFQSLTLTIQKLHSLLNLASALNMVSGNNARILQSELTAIREQCAAGQKYYALTTLDDVLKTIYPEEVISEDQSLGNGQPTQALEEVNKKIKLVVAPDVRSEKKDIRVTLAAPTVKKEITSATSLVSPALNTNRKDAILQLIKDKGEVSIKDISKDFYDCSEKTIQRDINALVEEGRLRKEGDRRWSRYSIGK